MKQPAAVRLPKRATTASAAKQPAPANLSALPRLTTPETVDYLRDAHGVRSTLATLTQLRFEGRGPRYCVILRRVYYTPHDIDQWIAKTVSAFSDSRRRAAQPRL